MGGKTTETALLLTNDERRAKLESLLGHRFTERGKLLLPTTAEYNSLQTSEGLAKLAYEMCRWIGLKPNGLSVMYSASIQNAPELSVDLGAKTITINRQYRAHPYTAGGLLALGVIQYFIERYDHTVPDQALVEFATIETGLGLWIANALRPALKLRRRLYHSLNASWFHADGLKLETLTPRQYVEQLVSYAHENRVPAETYTPHILKRCQYLLPKFVADKATHYLPEATSSLQHTRAANLMWANFGLISLIVGSGIVLGVFAWSQRTPSVDPQQQEQLQAIAIIKQSYDSCIDTAVEQQNSYDPNDLFMNRQVDATKSRCESLRNEYNFALEQYEKTYLK